MYGAFAGYLTTSMISWLNQYTSQELYPFIWFGYTTLGMTMVIAVTYFMGLLAAVSVPEGILEHLRSEPDAETLITEYQQRLTDEQSKRRTSGLRVAAGGGVAIVVAFALIHSYGLAENWNGNQQGFSKILLNVVYSVSRLTEKIDSLSTQQDSLRRDVRTNGGRITKLELRNKKTQRRDSLSDRQILNNQKTMLNRDKSRSAPKTVQPIQQRKPWWESGTIKKDSLDLPTVGVIQKKGSLN